MIEEHIKQLPGGEKLLIAQRLLSISFGIVIGGFLGALFAVFMAADVLDILDKASQNLINNQLAAEQVKNAMKIDLLSFFFILMIFLIFGIIAYYYLSNSADKIFTEEKLKETK